MSDTQYSLDAEKINDAIAILDRELDELRSCMNYQAAANARWLLILWCAMLGATAVLAMLGSHGILNAGVALVIGGSGYLTILGFSLPSNIRAVRALVRLRRTQKQLGVRRIGWLVGWREAGRRLLSLLPLYGGVGLLVISFGGVPGTWLGDLLILAGLACMGWSFVLLRRRALVPFEKRVAETLTLRALLLSKKTDAGQRGSITLSKRDYKHIADTERAVVALDQQAAVEKFANAPQQVYWPVQQSATALAASAALLPYVRLQVQARIEDLATCPEPADAKSDSNGAWTLRVPEAETLIRYTVGTNPRRIIVHDVVARESHREGEERTSV